MSPLELGIELVAGLLAGVFAGVTGAGGGVLLVPILVWLGLPPLSATATSNVAISLSALSGTWTNLRRFALPWRRVLLLAIPAMLAAPLGVWLAHSIPAVALLLSFAGFNVIAAGLMQLRLRSEDRVDAGAGDSGSDLPPANAGAALATGFGGGTLAGLFGVGGGLIMVPFQTLLLSTPVRLASRISLAVVLFASMAAVAAHLGAGADIHWRTGLVIAVGGLAGAPIGARWLHRLTGRQSTRIIQATMLVVAASFVARALL
ncbi:MAG: sulfite exporter TauE/SafE family protein [Actinobacteria bacterium]|nr:MAG: sulfite exporter TauE/SafE family protein [Actinomycetota bacterium]